MENENEIGRRLERAAAEFSEIVSAGGVEDVWVVTSIANTLADYLGGQPETWGKFKALVQTIAAAKRFAAYVKANPQTSIESIRRAAQDAFPEWQVLEPVDANQYGVFVEAESAGQRRRIQVVRGAGGEWVCNMGSVSVGVPAGVIE